MQCSTIWPIHTPIKLIGSEILNESHMVLLGPTAYTHFMTDSSIRRMAKSCTNDRIVYYI